MNRRTMVALALMVGGAGTIGAGDATSGAVRNVVLVHGGFVDGSGWQGVYRALKKDALIQQAAKGVELAAVK
jgi:hypothetical protein